MYIGYLPVVIYLLTYYTYDIRFYIILRINKSILYIYHEIKVHYQFFIYQSTGYMCR